MMIKASQLLAKIKLYPSYMINNPFRSKLYPSFMHSKNSFYFAEENNKPSPIKSQFAKRNESSGID